MANKKYDVQEILTCAYKVIAVYGYTPKSKQTETTPATANIMERVVKGIEPCPEVSAVNTDELHNAFYHFVDRKDKYERGVTDFDRTLGDILDRGSVTANQFSFVATVLPSYRKAVKRDADYAERKAVEAERGKASEWIGDPKARLTLTATIESVRALETVYGTSFLTKLLSEGENHLVWFASNDPEGSYKHFGNVGDEVTFKATVKKHDEFNGVKQTVVTRCVAVA